MRNRGFRRKGGRTKWIIISITLILIGYIGLMKTPTECPVEFKKDSVNVMPFQFGGGSESALIINEEDYLDNKGYFSNNGWCKRGVKEGENKNYAYCDLTYTRKQSYDETGVILEKERWELNLIYNHQNCDNYRQEDMGAMSKGLPLYKCEIISMVCKQ